MFTPKILGGVQPSEWPKRLRSASKPGVDAFWRKDRADVLSAAADRFESRGDAQAAKECRAERNRLVRAGGAR